MSIDRCKDYAPPRPPQIFPRVPLFISWSSPLPNRHRFPFNAKQQEHRTRFDRCENPIAPIRVRNGVVRVRKIVFDKAYSSILYFLSKRKPYYEEIETSPTAKTAVGYFMIACLRDRFKGRLGSSSSGELRAERLATRRRQPAQQLCSAGRPACHCRPVGPPPPVPHRV